MFKLVRNLYKTKINFFITGFIAIVISGCAMKQEFHSFPMEASRMMQDEKCNCEKIEFVETGSKVVFDQGLVPRTKSEGYTLHNEGRRSYSLVKSALHVEEKRNLLTDIAEAAISGLIAEALGGTVHSYRTFDEVKQTQDVVNPFDGEQYIFSASSNGRSAIIEVRKKHQDKNNAMGVLVSQHSGDVNGLVYKLSLMRQWDGITDEEKGADGETVWHQYPDGAYIVLSNEEGLEVKVFQGAIKGKVLGMDAFTGYKSVAFVPKGTHIDIKRDFFLFYYAAEYFQEFVDDVLSLPECLNNSEEPISDKCPGNIVLQ